MALAALIQQNHSVRAIAQVWRRSPSTISRGLRRNAQPARYFVNITARPAPYGHAKEGRAPGKLHRHRIPFGLMRHFLDQLVARTDCLTLACVFPESPEHLVADENIYNCIFDQPVSELEVEPIKGAADEI